MISGRFSQVPHTAVRAYEFASKEIGVHNQPFFSTIYFVTISLNSGLELKYSIISSLQKTNTSVGSMVLSVNSLDLSRNRIS